MELVEIIIQTDDFIIINKPYGISVHKDDAEIGLTTWVARQLNVSRVWLVHRLDKVTSGLLILALNGTAAAELSGLFAQHKIQKTYLALSVCKPKKKQGMIIGDMEKARRGAWKLVKTKTNPAMTRFYSVSCEPNLRLFILMPQTGKTHQLRVAMKSLGSPILGDELYAGNTMKTDRTYLHAYRLVFMYKNKAYDVCFAPHKMKKCGVFFERISVQQQISQINHENT